MTALTLPRAEDRFSSVLRLAHENAATLDVADLAEHAGYSPFHFTRIFGARMGIGPGQHLIALRIDAAKRMLLAGDDAVIDVAAAVGFDSLSSFSRRFRSTVGVTLRTQLRRLAHHIGDRPPRPFTLLRPHPGGSACTCRCPGGVQRRGDASVWVGWYLAAGTDRAAALGRARLRVPSVAAAVRGGPVPARLRGARARTAGHAGAGAAAVAVHPAPLTGPGG